MAKAITLKKGKTFEFPTAKSGGGEQRYPWDEWFNGTLYMIERSEGPENDKGTIEPGTETEKRDYGVPNNAMKPKLVTAGRRRYKVVQISTKDTDGQRLKNALLIRARDMDEAERVAENVRRVEDKAKLKAKAKANGNEADEENGDESE